MIARALVLACFLAVVAVAPDARAARCDGDAIGWVARCAKSASLPMRLSSCPAGLAIIEVAPAGVPPLGVELSGSATAFRTVGAVGLSPIGDFADWKEEPAELRHAFDAVVACVEREAPNALLSGGDSDAPHVVTETSPAFPRLLILALLAALFPCVLRRRLSQRAYSLSALAAALALVTWGARHLLQPFAFFHQNGQGPDWIAWAVAGDAGTYGPGYPEMFRWIAAPATRPERAVALFQGLLAATVPVSAYVIARAVSSARVLALVAASAVASDAVLVRVARSESYFATIGALLCAAAAILCVTDTRRRSTTWLAGTVSAALLIACAGRIHPVAWVPSAVVPWALACRPGRTRDRVRKSLVSSALIAAIASPLVLPTMRVTLAGGLSSFATGARATFLLHAAWPAALLAIAALLALPRVTRPLATRAAVLAAVLTVAIGSNVLRSDARVVSAAYLHLFAPTALAAALAMLSLVRVTPAVIASVVALATHGIAERSLTRLPTDARELAWCLDWRETLPSAAQVAWLPRAGDRVLTLPLVGRSLPTGVFVSPGGRASFSGDGPRYYYRSSLCSTPEGAVPCAEFEKTVRLRRVEARRIPGIASLPWLPLPADVEVALFAIER